MVMRPKQTTSQVLVLCAVICGLAGCSIESKRPSFDIYSVKTYRDIPGVTNEEIEAIEALKSSNRSFSFGTLPTTEAYILPDGDCAGFAIMFCELLSDLFGIPFVQEFHTWDSLKTGIDNKTIDFTGELTQTPDRMVYYFMSHPIAERSLGVFTNINSPEIETEVDINGLKVGFFNGTITAQFVIDAYPELDFEIVFFKDFSDAAMMIETGLIDAFIIDAVESYTFKDYAFIQSKELFQRAYTSVSLTTSHPEFESVISVMNKYITAGGVDKLYNLYRESMYQYAKYTFSVTLTDEERGYLEEITADDATVLIAAEYDNYPVGFYNEAENEFQGIALDVLKEISNLTGIKFQVATDRNTSWPLMIEMLRTGKVSLITQLLYSDEHEKDFIWSLPYASSHYALISKMDYPYLEMFQVVRSTVGLGNQSAYKDLYHRWFPNNNNVKYYDLYDELLDALEKGEIDLWMASEHTLLGLTNYRERPGYKVNVLFNSPIEESFFGFNKNDELLCSIIKKAQLFTDAARIEKNWISRTYDYSRKMANERSLYLSVSASVLLFLLIIMVVLYLKNNRTRELYREQMITLSTIYKSLPDLVYSKDVNGKYVSCNDSFEEFIGHPESEIIGKTPSEAYTADMIMAYKLMAMDRKVIKERTIVKGEGWLIYPDLSRRLFEIVKVPLINDGKVSGLLGLNRDITKYKEAEKAAQEASRAKSNFLAKMSHEIRTPMNAIIGMTELALRTKELNAAHKHILTVKQAGAHLLSIINDILDFSKIEMGKLEILPDDYSFSSLINDVISIIRMRVIDSQIRFAVFVDSKIPDALIGDETRIRQVLLNILNNAVKYTEKGFVSFTVNGEMIAEDVFNLNLEVMDSGRGIKQEDIKNLFGEYTQFDMEGNRGIEGVGLGLAISWNIIKAMGGDINVYSEYGRGSTFTITLPQRLSSHEVLAVVENIAEKRAIVYERREIYANSIMDTIENLGVKCSLVSNDVEFRDSMYNYPDSFVFISYNLLEMNRNAIAEFGANAKIVVLAEFGESIPDKKLSVLAMPVYSISIANVFNGITDSFGYSENDEHIVRFIAPSAKILIVDDINTNLKVAEGLMLPYKMQVSLCKSGKEAIEAVKATRFDIIFMDHKMPEMDGIMATLYIRTLNDMDPYYKNVPIIVLTANAVAGTREMFLNNGFNDFLSKPIDTVKLNSMLEKWIPRDKQKNVMGENIDIRVVRDKETDDEVIIEGIDTRKGILISGGTIESYLETLSIFHADGLKKIKDIKSSLGASDLPLFTIYIHALKSALANIGAGEMSSAARTLEVAGEQNDFGSIDLHIGRFLSDLELLLENINSVLAKQKKITVEDKNNEIIIHELLKLKDALNKLDAGIINRTIDNLRIMNLSENIADAIQNISDKILVCEYGDAIGIIEKIVHGEKQCTA